MWETKKELRQEAELDEERAVMQLRKIKKILVNDYQSNT